MSESGRISLTIQPDQKFQCIACQNGYTQFNVKTVTSALHIGLFTTDDITQGSDLTDPKYIIKIAEGQAYDSRISLENPQIVCETYAPYILISGKWDGFWICVLHGSISLGRENEYEPLLKWDDPQSKSIVKMGFRIKCYGYGEHECSAQADIVVDSVAKTEHSGVHWMKCSYGQIPENAFVGSREGDRRVFVVRTYDFGMFPGTLKEGANFCEVVRSHRLKRIIDYEALVNFDGEWVKVKREIPPLALVAGRYNSQPDIFNAQPLYIGRAMHNGNLTLGVILATRKSLQIVTTKNEETIYYEFEILCHKPPGLPRFLRDSEEREQPKLKWVYSCGGRMPRNAFVIDSHENQPVVLIRAQEGAPCSIWYPGWMCYANDTHGYVAANRKRIVTEYEVLCDFNGYWERTTAELGMPKYALVLDKDEDNCDIYIARATHNGRLLCGRVIEMTCEIPYGNDNIKVKEFEVLCY